MKNLYFQKLKVITLFGLLFLFSFNVLAQVGIGNTDPAASSLLDVRDGANNKGILIPRINIEDLTTAHPVNSPEISLLVYNTNATTGKGFYYWDGTRWRTSFSQNSNTGITENIVEPDAWSSVSPDFRYNSSRIIPDSPSTGNGNYIDIIIPVSGIIGNTTLVTIELNISHIDDRDLDIFLSDPTGEWLELSTNNGGTGDNYTNTVFADAAATNITAGTAPFTGSYQPEGSLVASGDPIYVSGTIATLAGFNGLNPNGNWTLRIADDSYGSVGTFDAAILSITGTPDSANWVSLGEVAIDYFDNTTIIVQSTYSGDPQDFSGVVTALTRSTTTVSTGTTATTLPGNVLSFASDSPGGAGTGNFWVNTFNQARDTGLTDDTTYYYQLWRKGNIETPVSSNETFSLLHMRM